MKTIITVLKKELRRFFTDSRMLISIFLPGSLIYVIYSLIGGVVTDMMTPTFTEFEIYVENEPAELSAELSELYSYYGWTVIKNSDSTLTKEDIMAKVSDGSVDLYVIYEENFAQKVNEYETNPLVAAPYVEIYCNSTVDSSSHFHSFIISYLDGIEKRLSNKFDINPNGEIDYDLATDDDMSVKMIGMILPYILITFLISGALGICSESIAGEKERGTIATLLVTPIKRRDLVIGKISALGITTMAGAFVSFLGLILSIPKLAGADFSFDAYGTVPLVMLFFVVVITALFFTTILTIISTFAKSVKEASSLASPLMILVMVVGVTGMMNTSANTNLLMYIIPIYNSTQALTGILNKAYDIWAVVITVVTNIVYISLGVYLLTKMFDDEKIMFNK